MKKPLSLLLLLFLLLPAGCGYFGDEPDQTAYQGPSYPPTRSVKAIFLPGQAGASCRVFAQLLITIPAHATGAEIKKRVETEARARGADLILIGESRRMEDDDGFTFAYYGPGKEYLCTEKWCGWKYGYDAWEEQGEFVSLGYPEWGNPQTSFETPLMLQAAFLRCQR